MIQLEIVEHLKAVVKNALPSVFAEDGVTIRCTGAEAVYDRDKGRNTVASETMQAEIWLTSKNPIDHRALVKKLGRTEVDLDGTMAWRVYRRHRIYDHQEINELKRMSFVVDFTYEIEGD